jgi:hypothetical protein
MTSSGEGSSEGACSVEACSSVGAVKVVKPAFGGMVRGYGRSIFIFSG